MALRLHKDYDDISCDLKKDNVRFNYGMLEDKGGFLSVKGGKAGPAPRCITAPDNRQINEEQDACPQKDKA